MAFIKKRLIYSLKHRWPSGSVSPAGFLQYMVDAWKWIKQILPPPCSKNPFPVKHSQSTRKFKSNIQEVLTDTMFGDSVLGYGLLVCFSIFLCLWRQSGNFRYQKNGRIKGKQRQHYHHLDAPTLLLMLMYSHTDQWTHSLCVNCWIQWKLELC